MKHKSIIQHWKYWVRKEFQPQSSFHSYQPKTGKKMAWNISRKWMTAVIQDFTLLKDTGFYSFKCTKAQVIHHNCFSSENLPVHMMKVHTMKCIQQKWHSFQESCIWWLPKSHDADGWLSIVVAIHVQFWSRVSQLLGLSSPEYCRKTH
jgi:hypothetical protein